MTLCRRDLKPAMWCEFEAIGRKANTMRAGPGKISVRKFMQGESLPLRILVFDFKHISSFGTLSDEDFL